MMSKVFSYADEVYSDMIYNILHYGDNIHTRNGDCKRMPTQVLRYRKPDITISKVTFDETPLITVRKTAWKTALREMEWFLSGSNNIKDLHESVHPWWKPWAKEDGTIPWNYSIMFRASPSKDGMKPFDQIKYLIDGIKNHPFSRRNVITTWNTAAMVAPETPITNCHGTVIQALCSKERHIYSSLDTRLDLIVYQRSVDVIAGLPHNWIQYWALLMWLARRTGYWVKTLTWIGGDVHVYKEHTELAKKIVNTVGEIATYSRPPYLVYTPTSENFLASDFSLDLNYEPVLTDKAELIV